MTARREIGIIFFKFSLCILIFNIGKNGSSTRMAHANLRRLNVIGGICVEAIFDSVDVPPPAIAASIMKKNGLNFCMLLV